MASTVATNSEKQWTKKTVLQLKGALAQRQLQTDGNKEEMVRRLVEYDVQQAEVEVAESEKMEEEEEVPVKSFLTRRKVRDGYEANLALRTLTICPFPSELLQDSNLLTWLNESKTYDIRKTPEGEVAAEMGFSTIDMGIAAHADLQIHFPDCQISRLKLSGTEDSGIETNQLVVKDSHGTFWGRLVVLEDLSAEMNTEEKLKEFFPEASNAIPFQFDPTLAGYAVLEFPTFKEANDYVNCVGNEPIEIDDVSVKVLSLTKYCKEHPEVPNKTDKEEKEVLEDEARIALNAEIIEITKLIPQLKKIEMESMEGIFENLDKLYNGKEELYRKKLKLDSDTELRKKRGDKTMPEPDDQVLDAEAEALTKKVTTSEVKKELEELLILHEEAKREEKQVRDLITKVNNKLPPDQRNKNIPVMFSSEDQKKSNTNAKKTNANKANPGQQIDHKRILYVAGLPQVVTEGGRKQLFRMFSRFGTVEYVSAQSFFGFVTMATEEQARIAMAEINGQTFYGKVLEVKPRTFGGDYLVKDRKQEPTKRKMDGDVFGDDKTKRSVQLIEGLSAKLSEKMQKLEQMQMLQQQTQLIATTAAMHQQQNMSPYAMGMNNPASSGMNNASSSGPGYGGVYYNNQSAANPAQAFPGSKDKKTYKFKFNPN